ncbi:transcription elongation factor A protein 2 isoform X2 [Ahaetulla prasina]|uniref:transcription elongation factor A protein 2 isoform X2 n=1 Tax=Ahaetulla prasina TaxID=499056 RepID=UPI0026494D0D|nr:transcription elongation factor A protein 2 isoform X2 [Ahaetulla prasina]
MPLGKRPNRKRRCRGHRKQLARSSPRLSRQRPGDGVSSPPSSPGPKRGAESQRHGRGGGGGPAHRQAARQDGRQEERGRGNGLAEGTEKYADNPAFTTDASEDKRDEKKKSSLPASSSKEMGDSRDQSSIKRQESVKTPTTPKITTFPPVPISCDTVRGKCREMLTSALQTDNDYVAIGADCEQLAGQIEEFIFQDVKNTDLKYKNRIRSRLSNLKDSKNPDLRKNVLCGVITPEQIAVMTSEEMASNELKEIRKAMTKEAIREHQMAKTGGTQTDLFTCGKCKKKNCTYTQVQTRSSDEPMTTFVVCNECGNRWKFC